MWTILKFEKKYLGLLKKDLSNKLGDEVKFYLPKLKFQKFKKNKLYNSEMLLLGDYLFCYHSGFRNNKIINALKYCRGLKYFLSNCFNSQRSIDEFIKKCLNHEDDQGYIRQSFFEFNSNEEFTRVLGFDMNGTSIPAGCGQIVQLIYEYTATQVTNIVVPGFNGAELDIDYYICP